MPRLVNLLRRLSVAFLIVLFVGGAAHAADTVYGAPLSDAVVVKLSQLLDSPADYVDKTVKIEGLVIGVCPKRGCWIEVAGDREFESMRFKVADGEIVFPVDAKGKNATLEGVFTAMELTEEQAIARAKHFAEEKGEAFDPKSVKKGAHTMYQIAGKGGVIR